jgi:hypothetical protein
MSGLSDGEVTDSSKTVVGFDKDGNAYFSGHITATSGKISGFTIGGEPSSGTTIEGLWYGERGEAGSFYIIPSGNYSNFGTTIAGKLRTDWSLMLGTSFGVTKDGLLFASGGEIGGFSFGYIRLYAQESPRLVQKALYYDLGEDNPTEWKTIKESSFMLCPAGLRYEKDLMGQTEVKWKLIIGNNFGVSNKGGLYARSANITGRIDATSGSFSEGCVLGKNMVVGTWEDSFTSLSCGGATGITNLAALPTADTSGILLAAAENVPCFALRG